MPSWTQSDTFLTGGGGGGTGPLRTGAKPAKKSAAAQNSGGSSGGGLMLMIFLPWLLLSCLMLLFTFAYHYYHFLVICCILVCFLIGLLCLVLAPANKKGPMYYYLGGLCMLATALGVILGWFNYSHFMYQYFHFNEARTYTDVIPTEKAAAHSDAAVLVFTNGARVDTTKGLGFKAGHVYCVAPILDETQASRAEFWAVGVDCCSERGDFNCDDAWDPQAKSGVVVLDDAMWLPSNFDYFQRAVKAAEADYNIVSSEKSLYIRWVTDPLKVEEEVHLHGLYFLGAVTGGFLVVSIVLGALLHMAQRKPG